MVSYDLTIDPDYVKNWTLQNALRELMQNILDAETDENKASVIYDKETKTLTFMNTGGRLDTSTLLLGGTSKDKGTTRGKFGEGYKIASIICNRLSKPFKIENNSSDWNTRIKKSRKYNSDIITFEIEKPKHIHRDRKGIKFIVSNISEEEYEDLRSRTIPLMTEEELGEVYTNDKKELILLDTKHSGKIFVGGLYVLTEEKLKFGYDFNPSSIELDRDRSLIRDFDLKCKTSAVAGSCLPQEYIISNFNCIDFEYIKYSSLSVTNPKVKTLYEAVSTSFLEEHGADAYPCTSQDEVEFANFHALKPIIVKEQVKDVFLQSDIGKDIVANAMNTKIEFNVEALLKEISAFIQAYKYSLPSGSEIHTKDILNKINVAIESEKCRDIICGNEVSLDNVE